MISQALKEALIQKFASWSMLLSKKGQKESHESFVTQGFKGEIRRWTHEEHLKLNDIIDMFNLERKRKIDRPLLPANVAY